MPAQERAVGLALGRGAPGRSDGGAPLVGHGGEGPALGVGAELLAFVALRGLGVLAAEDGDGAVGGAGLLRVGGRSEVEAERERVALGDDRVLLDEDVAPLGVVGLFVVGGLLGGFDDLE